MNFIAPADAAFLISEGREHPMHVGGLLLIEQPPDADPDFVGDLYQKLLAYDDVRQAFRRRPATLMGTFVGVRWHEDSEIDLEYHVRLSALPRPGRIRELLTLVSRLHGALLDRHRPLWEFHLIEGVADGQFAIYYKVHHALVDGINTTRQIAEMFSADPATGGLTPLWANDRSSSGLPTKPAAPLPAPTVPVGLNAILRSASKILPIVADVAGVVPALTEVLTTGLRHPEVVWPFQAPKTMLNVKLSGARRYAAQSWSFQRMRAVAKAHDVTLNDVLLAMCSGALRRYLRDADQLPTDSLVAAVPVALPVDRSGDHGGNAVTMVLCRLATDVEDPHERLRQIHASMQTAKKTMSGRSALQISLFGLVTGAGPTAANMVPGFVGRGNPPYNLVISNVPGPVAPLYWEGSRVVGWYPVSIPSEGQALNITAVSYAGRLGFGLIGCRRSIPHLQRLLDDLEHGLAELE